MIANPKAPHDGITPAYKEVRFVCPFCDYKSSMVWGGASDIQRVQPMDGLQSATCQGCGKSSLWIGDITHGQYNTYLANARLIWPPHRRGPAPNADMPENVLKDYEEARAVLPHSPRAAGALLRLALQNLLNHLGQEGKDINDAIGALVRGGLKPKIAKACDVVRVTGNEAVHPGTIDTDDPEVVAVLFKLVNLIVEDQITEPQEIDALFDALPEDKKKGIENRDGKPVE